MEAPTVRFLLRLAPAFIIYSAANAQAPPVVPHVPGAPPTNNGIIANAARPPSEFKPRVPDGFGGLKEVPDVTEGMPDQTDSTTTIPDQPLGEPNDNGEQPRVR